MTILIRSVSQINKVTEPSLQHLSTDQVHKSSKLPTVTLDEMYINVLRHSVLEDCDEEDKSELNGLFR